MRNEGISKLYKIRDDDIMQALGIQTTLLDKVVQQRLRWSGHVKEMTIERIPHSALYMQDSN